MYEPGANESGVRNAQIGEDNRIPTNYLLIHGLRTYHQFTEEEEGNPSAVEIPSILEDYWIWKKASSYYNGYCLFLLTSKVITIIRI